MYQASVGISIEENRIAIASLKRTLRGVSLAAHAIYPLVKEGPEEKTAEVRDHIREFLEEHRIASADIFLGIPRDSTILQYIDLPVASKENLKGTLSYEMEKYIPFPAGEIYFDGQIVAEDKDANQLKVLLVGVKKEWIDPYVDREKPLGEGISGAEINSTAFVNYFSHRSGTPNVDTYAILCLEGEYLELSLINKRLLQYSRRIKQGQKADSGRQLVLQELDLLKNKWVPDQGRLTVVLCGSSSDSIAGLLKEREYIDLHHDKLAGTEIPSDSLAPAFGLALKGLQKMPMDINVIPIGLRKKVSKVGYYSMFVLAGLLIVSILAWGGSYLLHQKRVSDRLRGEIKKLSAEVASVQQTQAKINALEDRIDALNALRRRHIPVLGLLLDLSKALPETAWIDRLSLNEKTGDMEGYADSASALISILAASPLLMDVAFLSPITKVKDGKERFRIGFKVR